MSVKLSPVFNSQIVDENGNPANGWLINTYIANSSTPATTYTDSTGGTPQSNPIVINTLGFPTVGQIWLTGGVTYKLELTNASGTVKKTEDQISGVNDLTLSQDEWLAGPAPTYISSTQFSLVGDQTSAFHVGRRVKYTISAGTGYGTITASAFTSLSTITVDSTGSNPLDSGLSDVSYGLLRADNFTQSIGLDHSTRLSAPIVCAATLDLSKAGGDNVHVTGSTGPVTAITLAQGHERTVVWDSTPTLTNGASLILREGASKTVTANSVSRFRGEASGVVREVSYQQSTTSAGFIMAGPVSGSDAGPTFKAGASLGASIVLLGSYTTVATPSVVIIGDSSSGNRGVINIDWSGAAYDDIVCRWYGHAPTGASNIAIQVSHDSGATFISSGNYVSWAHSTDNTGTGTDASSGAIASLHIGTTTQGTSLAEESYYELQIIRPFKTDRHKIFKTHSHYVDSASGNFLIQNGGGRYIASNSAINSIQFLAPDGPTTFQNGGILRVFGVRNV